MRKILSRGASKEAALYFDDVFPNDLLISELGKHGILAGAENNCVPYGDVDSTKKVLLNLVPGRADVVEHYVHQMMLETALYGVEGLRSGAFGSEEEFNTLSAPTIENLKEIFNINFNYEDIVKDFNGTITHLKSRQRRIIKTLGFLDAPEWIPEVLSAELDKEESSRQEVAFALSLRGLNLIDPSRLSWDQILEFRQDSDSRSALRRLRLFFQEEMSGKDPSYIIDKLAALAEDHDKAAKLWGLDTSQKALSVAFTHKSLLATAAGGLAASLGGAPIGVAAAAALLVPLGSFGLEFSRAVIDAAKSKTREPTQFLTNLKKLGEGTRTSTEVVTG
jgi:hypothetical protein